MDNGPVDAVPRCSFFLKKKNRKCKMLVKPGNLFCGEHADQDPSNTDRIPCPLDPKHTILKDELEDHLKNKCNSRVRDAPWIVFNSNAVVEETKAFHPIDCRPCDEDVDRLALLLSNDRRFSIEVPLQQESCTPIEEHLERNPNFGPKLRKHLLQEASLIGHLLKRGLLVSSPKCCLLELGAGKAELTYWMTKASPRTRYLLIDRSGSRNKFDNAALREDPSLEIHRIRAAIEHIDLTKVPYIQECSSLVCVEKHFCGSATDAGVRSLMECVRHGLSLDGLLLAPCCHHKLRYSEYVGHEYLESLGLGGEETFAALRHLSTWAVCGLDKVEHLNNGHEMPEIDTDLTSTLDAKSRSVEWRMEVGQRAKLLIEMGRVDFLRKKLGWKVDMVRFVREEISPENLLIVGVRDGISVSGK